MSFVTLFCRTALYGALVLLTQVARADASPVENGTTSTESYARIEGISPIHSIDGRLVLLDHKVSPGHHLVQVAVCGGGRCLEGKYLTYKFFARAGLLYRINGNVIAVLDMNDKYQRKVDELTLLPGSTEDYIDRKEKAAVFAQQQEQLQHARAIAEVKYTAAMEARRSDLPLMRKIGARICKIVDGVEYVGYVEAITETKVQVRVAEAYFRQNPAFHPGVFEPTIIWENPMKWDSCEN